MLRKGNGTLPSIQRQDLQAFGDLLRRFDVPGREKSFSTACLSSTDLLDIMTIEIKDITGEDSGLDTLRKDLAAIEMEDAPVVADLVKRCDELRRYWEDVDKETSVPDKDSRRMVQEVALFYQEVGRIMDIIASAMAAIDQLRQSPTRETLNLAGDAFFHFTPIWLRTSMQLRLAAARIYVIASIKNTKGVNELSSQRLSGP
jgi:hypothetical protein